MESSGGMTPAPALIHTEVQAVPAGSHTQHAEGVSAPQHASTTAAAATGTSAPVAGKPAPAVWDPDRDRFIYSREEILRSPSVCEGMNAHDEAFMRGRAMKYIASAGTSVFREVFVSEKGGPDRAFKELIAHAMLLFHRFFGRMSMRTHDAMEIATACLMLAGKVHEVARHSDVLVRQYMLKVLGQDPAAATPEQFASTRASILAAERALLYALEYFVDADSPYAMVDELVARFNCSHAALDAGYRALNDMMQTTLPLQYHADVLAYAALYIGAAVKARAELPAIAAGCTVSAAALADIREQFHEYLRGASSTAHGSAATAAASPVSTATGTVSVAQAAV